MDSIFIDKSKDKNRQEKFTDLFRLQKRDRFIFRLAPLFLIQKFFEDSLS